MVDPIVVESIDPETGRPSIIEDAAPPVEDGYRERLGAGADYGQGSIILSERFRRTA
jgi:hypothetical protein